MGIDPRPICVLPGTLPGMTKHFEITFDGGSINNPGKGYGSYRLTVDGTHQDVVQLDFSPKGEKVTNNQAEYRTLIAALEAVEKAAFPEADETKIRVYGDSKLVIEQLSGRWKVKNVDLQPLHLRAAHLMQRFAKVELTWRGRAWAVKVLGH